MYPINNHSKQEKAKKQAGKVKNLLSPSMEKFIEYKTQNRILKGKVWKQRILSVFLIIGSLFLSYSSILTYIELEGLKDNVNNRAFITQKYNEYVNQDLKKYQDFENIKNLKIKK